METTAPKKGITYDIAQLGTAEDAERPIDMEIASNRDGQGTGVFVRLIGKDSAQYRKLNRHLQNRRLDELSRTRKLKMTAEQNEAETLRLLVECVLGWKSRLYERVDGVLVPLQPEQFAETYNLRGEELPFSKENVKRVFTVVPEIREQVEDFLADRANFVQGSPSS